MEHRENLLGVVETFFRWKKPILGLCLLAGIGAVIISLTLPNYYKSSTVYYVASPDQALPDLLGTRTTQKKLYGFDADVDRNLSICMSNELVDFIINKFDLYQHYDIRKDDEKSASKVRKRFMKLYEAQRTKYDAVQLSVEDTDKEKARDIVLAVRQKVEHIAKDLIKNSIQKSITSTQASINAKQQEVQTIGDSLRVARDQYGIYNTKSQTEFISSQVATAEAKLALHRARLTSLKTARNIDRDTIAYVQAYVSGLENELNKSNERLQLLNKGLPQVVALEDAYTQSVEQLNLDKENLKQLQSAYQADPPVLFVVEEASLPLEKSRPKRSIICIASVLIAFLLALMAALLFDMYKGVDWNKIVHAR